MLTKITSFSLPENKVKTPVPGRLESLFLTKTPLFPGCISCYSWSKRENYLLYSPGLVRTSQNGNNQELTTFGQK